MSDTLFSKMVKAGARTYFIDVKEARSGDKFIQVSESLRREDGTYGHHRIRFFRNALLLLIEGLQEAAEVVSF